MVSNSNNGDECCLEWCGKPTELCIDQRLFLALNQGSQWFNDGVSLTVLKYLLFKKLKSYLYKLLVLITCAHKDLFLWTKSGSLHCSTSLVEGPLLLSPPLPIVKFPFFLIPEYLCKDDEDEGGREKEKRRKRARKGK